MYGGRGFARVPYGHSGSFKGGDGGFRPPMPRYQSSPRLPQAGNGSGNTPPHQGRYPSPNHPSNMKSPPHFMQSPPHFMQSPPHFMQSPPHYLQSPPHGNEFNSPNQSPLHRFEYNRSPRGSPRGRGSFPPGAGGRGRGSPRYHKNSNSRKDNDCNPGGSNDINVYYNHNMVEDPWKNLAPVPVSKAAITTT